MNETINKEQFIDAIRRSRAEWDFTLAQLDEIQLLAPGACGEWSVKDVSAHLTWHEREMTEEDLINPANFGEMPTDWIPWQVIASNTYKHYQNHLPQIQALIVK